MNKGASLEFQDDGCIVPSSDTHILGTKCYELLNLSCIKQTPGQRVSIQLEESQRQRQDQGNHVGLGLEVRRGLPILTVQKTTSSGG